MLEAEAALTEGVEAANGSYAAWTHDKETHLCEHLLRGLAPRPSDEGSSSVRSVCEGARGTLASSLIVHHGWLSSSTPGCAWLCATAQIIARQHALATLRARAV
jgi:hypothetical protein